MAEPLKNSFGPDVAHRIAEMIEAVHPGFDRSGFLEHALHGYDELELTPRARQIADALGPALPEDPASAIRIITESLGPELGHGGLEGMASFLYLPFVFFVADRGLGCFEESMRAQYELTKRFTAEFSVRAFIERHPVETMLRLRDWTADPNVHVRRLVSEGTRPRLPWAPRLREFQRDPAPVVELLEMLKDDPEEYVRRSVANNLNDIAKDHPAVVVEVAARWWEDGDDERRRMIRHGLRTLIKAGDPGALAVLGYGADNPAEVTDVRCTPGVVSVGEKVQVEIDVSNGSTNTTAALVDLRVHFIKADGSARPKVFKGGEIELQSGETKTVRKTISLAQHTTRKHYAGSHEVDVLLNGVIWTGVRFDVTG